MVSVGLCLPSGNVGVVSALARRGVAIAQGIRVDSIGPCHLCRERKGCALKGFHPPSQRGRDQAERAGANSHTQRLPLPIGEMGTLGGQGEHTGRHILAGRNHQLVVVGHRHADTREVVGVVSANVDLSGLGVAECHAIVNHGRMLGAKTVDGHGFHTANATIVLHTDAGKVLHCIGHMIKPQLAQLLGRKRLGGMGACHIAVEGNSGHLHAAERNGIGLRQCSQRAQQERKSTCQLFSHSSSRIGNHQISNGRSSGLRPSTRLPNHRHRTIAKGSSGNLRRSTCPSPVTFCCGDERMSLTAAGLPRTFTWFPFHLLAENRLPNKLVANLDKISEL